MAQARKINLQICIMARNSKLDNLCSQLFFSAIVVNRFGRVSYPLIAYSFAALSTLLYLSGYIVWKAAIFQDESERHALNAKQKETFDRLFQHNNFYHFSALIGIVASILTFYTLTHPLFFLYSGWLYFVSNALWCKAEQMTLDRLDEDKPQSDEYLAQKTYNDYARLATLISFISVASFTLCLLVPPLTVPVGLTVSINMLALNLFAARKWGESCFMFKALNPQPTAESHPSISESTYLKLNHHLGTSELSPSHEKMALATTRHMPIFKEMNQTSIDSTTPTRPFKL